MKKQFPFVVTWISRMSSLYSSANLERFYVSFFLLFSMMRLQIVWIFKNFWTMQSHRLLFFLFSIPFNIFLVTPWEKRRIKFTKKLIFRWTCNWIFNVGLAKVHFLAFRTFRFFLSAKVRSLSSVLFSRLSRSKINLPQLILSDDVEGIQFKINCFLPQQ